MPWLLALPGHQHAWYWVYRKGRSLFYMRKDFNYLCHVSAKECKYMFMLKSSQAHNRNQCRPRFMEPHGIIRPQWVQQTSLTICTLRWRQNGCRFADDIFKCSFLNEYHCILIKITRMFISKGSIYNIPVLVQIIAWHQTGDEPLSEPRVAYLTVAHMRHWASRS